MLEVTTMALGSHAGSQALTQHLQSHLVGRYNFSHIERNVKLENNIREKKTIYLVCVINDVVFNFSVVKMLLVSLNLNKCHMPTGTASA